MGGLEIGLLALGAIFFIGSFFVQEKLSSSDVDQIKKLSEKEVNIILEKQLGSAEAQIQNAIYTKLDDSFAELERKFDRETNEKIMSIGEYSDNILSKMDKTHEEIMFMYDMLNDKQDKLTQLTREAQNYESHLRGMTAEVTAYENAAYANPAYAQQPYYDQGYAVQPEMAQPMQEAPVQAPAPEYEMSAQEASAAAAPAEQEAAPPPIALSPAAESEDDDRERIISMFNQGYTQVEIAKKIGVGLGEIQLILGLYGGSDET